MTFRLLLPLTLAAAALAADNPFLGKWDITAKGPDGPWIYWLEVKESGGKLSGMFLARGGSVFPLAEVKLEGAELVFWTQSRQDPKIYYRAKMKGSKLAGIRDEKGEKVMFTGVRPPTWGTYDANATHQFGAPVELFAGTSLAAWGVQNPKRPNTMRVSIRGSAMAGSRACGSCGRATMRSRSIDRPPLTPTPIFDSISPQCW